MNKKKEIDDRLYRIKVLLLALKYAKHIDQVLLYSIQVAISSIQLSVVISQPIPKYNSSKNHPGGLAIEGRGRPEFIESKEGVLNKIITKK